MTGELAEREAGLRLGQKRVPSLPICQHVICKKIPAKVEVAPPVLKIDYCSYHGRVAKDILGGSKIRGTKKGPKVQNLCDFCDLGFLQ